MPKLSYKTSGVDIDKANATKNEMAKSLNNSGNARVLNKAGAFATLFDGSFPEYQEPVLVFKTEEPGSKQKLALKHRSIDTICFDLINHLVNDAIVMGAKPLSVQDCIVCGKIDKEIILKMVSAFSKACKENDCVLTGGETSEQPSVLAIGTYILTASIVGVVEKKKIIDGSKIQEGDVVLGLASRGIHTNGFSLVQKIMEKSPEILKEKVDGKNFIESILTPHFGYYNCLKDLFGNDGLVGLAHITGGGIKENLNRILPENLNAEIDIGKIKILNIFKVLKKFGDLEDNDMMRTFNMGVGMTAVVKKDFVDTIQSHLKKCGVESYEIGRVVKGNKQVILKEVLNWFN